MKKKFQFPQTVSDSKIISVTEEAQSDKARCPCPCCGNITLPVPREEAVAFICPVCFWENDVFIKSADEKSDENHGLTLNEARKNYLSFGACSPRMMKYVRKPFPEEIPRG